MPGQHDESDDPITSGWQRRDDKLIRFDKLQDSVLVMRGWPAPMAWKRRRGEPWRHVRPDLDIGQLERIAGASVERLVERVLSARAPRQRQLSFPWCDDRETRLRAGFGRRRSAVGAWVERIPLRVRHLLRPLPTRQWHAFALLARCPGADDLLESCPALAFAVASSWAFRSRPVARPMRAARRVVRLRRRDALAWLGFPGTEAAVRVFAKIPSDELDVPLLLDVRRGLGDPDASRLLAHVPTVRRGVARVVADSELRSLVSPRLLADMAEQGQEGKSIRWAAAMRSCVAWAEVSEKPLSPLRDLAHLDRLHEALWHESLQREQEGWLNAVLPRPPVPGSPDIQPLVDVATIQREGESMGHCAASYVPEVYRGAAYLYRVLSPERATLELRPEDGRWVRTQLKGRGNTEVDAATYRAVDAWLGAAH